MCKGERLAMAILARRWFQPACWGDLSLGSKPIGGIDGVLCSLRRE
jgi:hypothetical protein